MKTKCKPCNGSGETFGIRRYQAMSTCVYCNGTGEVEHNTDEPKRPFHLDELGAIRDANAALVCRPANALWPDDKKHAQWLLDQLARANAIQEPIAWKCSSTTGQYLITFYDNKLAESYRDKYNCQMEPVYKDEEPEPKSLTARINYLIGLVEAQEVEIKRLIEKRQPIAWRCKDYGDGWIIYDNKAQAERYQRLTGCLMQEIYE